MALRRVDPGRLRAQARKRDSKPKNQPRGKLGFYRVTTDTQDGRPDMSVRDEHTSFAVVIPLYERRGFIGRAVASVLAQDTPAKEIIVVDDGSTDGGGDEVAQRFHGVRVIRQDNAGVGAARNRGMAEASTTWVALLDADDYWTPDHLTELTRIARAHPDAALLSTHWKRVDDRAEPIPGGDTPGRIERIDYFRRAAERGGPVWTSSAAISRAAFERVGGFGSARLGEDQEYWARLALHGPVVVSSAITAAYVRGTGSVTETERRAVRHEEIPRSGADALPVLATVAAALEGRSDQVLQSSLQAYWNAKLARKAREALSRGEFYRARALASFMRTPLEAWQRHVRFATALPPVVLRLAWRIGQRSDGRFR